MEGGSAGFVGSGVKDLNECPRSMSSRIDVVDIRLLVEDVDRTVAHYGEHISPPSKVVVDGTYVEFATGPVTVAAYRADSMHRMLGDSDPAPSGGAAVYM
jgi:hypothetical protein